MVAVVVFFLGVFLYSLPLALRQGGRFTLTINLAILLGVVGLGAVLIGLHELVHAAVMRVLGAPATFGAALIARILPVLYVSSPGHRFTRGQFLTIAAAPGVMISILGLPAVLSPWGPILVVPFAAHLAGCIGDGALCWRVSREPRDTRFEDLGEGLVFHHQGPPLMP